MNVVFLFPGSRDLRRLRQAGMAEPPAGTVFAQLHEPDPRFMVISAEGWAEPDRLEGRLMALAFAAIRAVAVDSKGEASGELLLPGGVHGRYAALRLASDPEDEQLVMGRPRFDLFGQGDCAATMLNLDWLDYEALRDHSQHYQGVGDRFKESRQPIPVMVLSGAPDPATVTAKLQACDPRGLTFGEMEGALTVLAGGLKHSYVVMQTLDEREGVLGWWYGVRSNGGAHAIVVAEPIPEIGSDRWVPSTVFGVFEFGRQRAD